MLAVRNAKSALRDIRIIWVWYAENADLETADRFLAALQGTTAMLAKQPNMGAAVLAKRFAYRDMRRFPVGGFRSICVFYRVVPPKLHVLRVVRVTRDLEVLFS